MISKLFTNEGRAVKNVVLGVATDDCMSKLTSPAFRGAQRHSGGEVLSVATLPRDEYPINFDECARIAFYRVGSTILDPASVISQLQHVDVNSWLTDIMHTRLTLINGFNFTVSVFWHEVYIIITIFYYIVFFWRSFSSFICVRNRMKRNTSSH